MIPTYYTGSPWDGVFIRIGDVGMQISAIDSPWYFEGTGNFHPQSYLM